MTTNLGRASAPLRARASTSRGAGRKPTETRASRPLDPLLDEGDWDADLAEALDDDQDGWDIPAESRSRGRAPSRNPRATARRAASRRVEWRALGTGWERAMQPHRGWLAWVVPASRAAGWTRVVLVLAGTAVSLALVVGADVAGAGIPDTAWRAATWMGGVVSALLAGIVLARVMGLPQVARMIGTTGAALSHRKSQLGALTSLLLVAAGVAAAWPGPVAGSQLQLVVVAVPALVGWVGLTGWAVRVTSRGAADWRDLVWDAAGLAAEEDPAAVLRARWRGGVGRGGKGIPVALAGSVVSHPVKFLPNAGWQAPIKIEVQSAGWEDLTKLAARNAIAKQEGTSADLVFPAPCRISAKYGMLTVFRRDPLRPVRPWAPAIEDDGSVVVATLADGTPVRAHVHRGTWGATHSLIVGMTGSGKGSVGAILGAGAAISGRCSVLLMDAGGGDSIPQLCERGVVDWVGDDLDECMTGLRAMAAVVRARKAAGVAKRDWDASCPLVVGVLPEVSLLLGDAEHGEEATKLVKLIVRLGRKYGVGLHMDTQAFNADEWGDTTIRAQLSNLFALKISDATVRSQVARQFPGTDLVVPTRGWPTEGYGWVKAVGQPESPLPARIHWLDKAGVREVQRLRRDIHVQHPAELVSALGLEAS